MFLRLKMKHFVTEFTNTRELG